MKIKFLHNERACESTLEPADRVAARVVNAEGHLPRFNTARVLGNFTGSYYEVRVSDLLVWWLDGW